MTASPSASSDNAATAPIFLLVAGTRHTALDDLQQALDTTGQVATHSEWPSDVLTVWRQPQRFASVVDDKLARVEGMADARIEMAREDRWIDDPEPLVALLDTLNHHFNPESFLAFHQALLRRHPDAVMTADASPGCMALDVEDLSAVHDAIRDAGFRPRILLMLRDPVARMIEDLQTRCRLKGTGDRDPRILSPKALVDAAQQPDVGDFSAYGPAIDRLEEVFGAERVHCALQEDLFSAPELDRLAEFLGIDWPEHDLDRIRPASLSELGGFAPASIGALRDSLSETIDACSARFGAERLSRLWPCALPAPED